MDDKDRLLLALLRSDSRQPVVALARDLGLSRSATQERLAKLQASGAVAGFTIVEGPKIQARQIAWLSVKFDGSSFCARVVPRLRKMPAITLVHSLTGPIDLIVRVEASDIAEIEAVRATIAGYDEVADVTTTIVLERHIE